MAYEKLVERLLASPRYGERWARHWLDLVRYAETAGHEFDYDIPNAYRYRDYVIRAFNGDLPYDQFVIEQIAGDLLDRPGATRPGLQRVDPGDGLLFPGRGDPLAGRRPRGRDAEDRQPDRRDLQDVLASRSPVARCHDHKFDPITNNDYYALAGFLRSSRHQQAPIDPPGRIGRNAQAAREAKEGIARWWPTPGRICPIPPESTVDEAFAAHEVAGPAVDAPGDGKDACSRISTATRYDGWSVTGNAFGDRPSTDGDFRLALDGRSPRLVAVRAGLAHSGLGFGPAHRA